MNTREKVMDWLSKAPKEILVFDSINVKSEMISRKIQGKRMPLLQNLGYEGTIVFRCGSWE